MTVHICRHIVYGNAKDNYCIVGGLLGYSSSPARWNASHLVPAQLVPETTCIGTLADISQLHLVDVS